MNEFDKVMSERTDFELYEIIYHKRNSYKPKALDSAEREFKIRDIDSEKLSKFEQKAFSIKKEKEIKAIKKTELAEKIKSIGALFLPTEKSSLSKNMLSLCIFLTLSYLFYLIRDFSLTVFIFRDFTNWDLSIVEYLLPFLLFPIGIYGLWKTKKYGWYLIVGLLTYYAFSTFYTGVTTYKYYSTNEGQGISNLLDNLFPKPDYPSLILKIVILGGTVIFLNRIKVLELFKIERYKGVLLIVIIGILSTMLWRSLL